MYPLRISNYNLSLTKDFIFQQTLGVTETLKSAMNPAVELTMSIEKLLLQTMAADNGTSGAIVQVRSKTVLKCILKHYQNIPM